ncbi:MAG: TonB-dependent receptor [Bacteroidales bacterium]|nr:TonB-dependent receptor [Bacteroidales bacterium]
MSDSIQKAVHEHIRACYRGGDNRQKTGWWKTVALMPVLAAVPLSNVAAQEQSARAGAFSLEEIVVTARRRDEGLQDVPLTVNVVTSEALEDLNVRRLEDLKTLVAGLTLSEDAIAPNASIRGVRFDSFASGFNSTVEFYLNDSPIVSSSAMQALFDIGQIEVLRGPQGTLRGRASPSGSITITTQRPDLEEFGGNIDLTANDIGGRNVRGALNLPIVKDMLALRVAGFFEENDAGRVKSINTGKTTKYEGEGYRVSLRYEPIDTFSLNLMHQRVEPDRFQYVQVESANIKDPNQPASPVPISAKDRRALTDIYATARQVQQRTGLEIDWQIGELAVHYAGSLTKQDLSRKNADDTGDFFGPAYPAALQELGQELQSDVKAHAHELRFSSSIGKLDYVFGGLYQHQEPINHVGQQTPVFIGFPSPATLAVVNVTPIVSASESNEKSVFGNLTWQVTDATELSAGLRHIRFDNKGSTIVGGNTIAANDNDWSKTIYSLSAKHNFTSDLMAYATFGTSWRPGINTVGNFNVARTAREQGFIELDPETSESLELGIKSSWLDDRLRLNAAVFYQQFDNYPYRSGGAGSGGSGVYYVSTNPQGVESVEQFNFVAAVPVDVYGTEIEAFFQATEQWHMSALFSWSKGEIDNGTIPCNDYLPADGKPDASGQRPTIEQIRAGTGGDNVASCQSSYRANFAPLWTATLQSEYSFPVASVEGYVRGILTLYGDSKNDPSNDLDDVSAYNILNLYAGIRSPDRKWEAMLYGKNVLDTERVLSRGSEAIGMGYQAIVGFGPNGPITQGQTGITGYRQVSMTEPREVGINLRYNF